MNHIFTGFGFGPIQAGLFVKEAFQSGNFSRIVVAEIDETLVRAVRENGGCYSVNVARSDGIEVLKVSGIEILNPGVEKDRRLLLDLLPASTEIVTSLPSVTFYSAGKENSVASLIAKGLLKNRSGPVLVYTAENNNIAAEIIRKEVKAAATALLSNDCQFLNTVIGKMSRLVTDPAEIKDLGLERVAPGLEKAFLVEQFNKILVTRNKIKGFTPGIGIFIEKEDLLPFEEAKLYGHNAIHALLAYVGAMKGYRKLVEVKDDPALMTIARDAFLKESGAALRKKHAGLGDPLFTEDGYREYALDLLERMTNPFLNDTVARAARDPARKLGLNDRIFGTMSIALDYGIQPANMAYGAFAGIFALLRDAVANSLPLDLRCDSVKDLDYKKLKGAIKWLWGEEEFRNKQDLVELVYESGKRFT